MKNPAKLWLGTLTVVLLALTPEVVPLGGSVAPVSATTPVGEVLRFDATNPDSFDPDSDTNWSDISGSRTGTLEGDASFDARSKAFEFDGTGDYIDLPDMTVDFSNGLAFHVTADFGEADSFERLVDFGNGSPGDNVFFGRRGTTDDLQFLIWRDTTATADCRAVGEIEDGFHTYSVVVDPDGDTPCALYRDGEALTVSEEIGTDFVPRPVTRTNNYLGKSNWSDDEYFDGSIQSVVIYNTAQTTPVCVPFTTDYEGDGTSGELGVDYQVVQFTTMGICTWSVPSGVTEADVLVVGGGGGGGSRHAGGGGAGELVEASDYPLVSGSVTVAVGAGGEGAASNGVAGSSGGVSEFKNPSGGAGLYALGGGGGSYTASAGDGGSGGGSNGSSSAREGSGDSSTQESLDGSATTAISYTFAGNYGAREPNNDSFDYWGGGGGGGAGGAGTRPGSLVSGSFTALAVGGGQLTDRSTAVGGSGGSGREISWLPNSLYASLDTGSQGASALTYAGGGGGGMGEDGLSGGSGGIGGGGSGFQINPSVESIGASNSGGGGGGSGFGSKDPPGADGGSGIVVVRYSLTPEQPTSTSVASGDGEITLSYAAPTDWGGGTLSLEYRTDAGEPWRDLGETGGTTTVSLQSDGSALENGETYSVSLRSKNTSGGSAYYSDPVSLGDVTPRGPGSVTWAPSNTFLDRDGGSITSLTFDTSASALGGAAITYSEGSSNCSIADSSVPTVSLSGTGDCVVTATSAAAGVYAEATASVTLRVFDGVGSGNTCDQNVSGTATVSTYVFDDDCLVVFTAADSASWIPPVAISSGEVLLIAGGGGGASYGGGGAGELYENQSFSFSENSYSVTVGAGGDGYSTADGSSGTYGLDADNDGEDSVFGALTASGGGAGGVLWSTASGGLGADARSGGSGGGGATRESATAQDGGSSVLTAGGSGFAGGTGVKNSGRTAGGGGGAGGVGGNGDGVTGGAGGVGKAVSIFSAAEQSTVGLGETSEGAVYFAGGGGGGGNGAASGSGGLGLGGDGGAYVSGELNIVDTVANSGGGGGGSTSTSTSFRAGDGGSGLVVLRYNRLAQATFNASTSQSSIAFQATATLSVSGGSGTGAVSYAVTSGDCTVSGTTVTATGGTGSCVVMATKAADASYAAATDSVTITLSKASQSALTISVDDSSLDYGDTATLSSSGGSGSGVVTFTVDSGDCSVSGTTVTATGGATDCEISAVKAADADYLVASAANTLTISISKASQTITFGSIATKTYGASPFTVSPTSDSGLTVSVSSSTEAVCTASGFTITLIAAGTCTVTADQGGNGSYSSATGVTQSFTVSAKAITVSVTVADKVYDASTSATVSSGTLSGVVSGDSVSFVAGNAAAVFGSKAVGSGKAVTVTVDGDELAGAEAANYSLTVSGSPTASITAKPVTVDVVPNGKTYDATQAATVSSSSLVGKETGDTVGVDESTITVVFDAPGAGTQTASASLASGVLTGADAGNYSASVGTVSSAVIAKANQTSLSFTSSSSATFGQPVTLVATGGSGSGSVTYSAAGDCSRSGAVITPTGAGSCSVSATRAADDNFNASTAATQTITIAKANQSINFTSIVPVSAVSGTTYTPAATATSGLAVDFDIAAPGKDSVCSLSSGVVTFVTSGTCVITAAQSGDSDYNAASSVTQTIVAGKINQTITFPAITGKDFDDPAFSAGASVSSGRTVTYATSTSAVCSVNASSGVISITTVGECTVTASSAGDSSYAAASDVSRTFTISPVVAGKPSITSVSFGDSSVTAAFVAPGFVGGDAIDGYQVVATSSGGSVTKPDCSTTSPCTITGLTNGESYTLTVAASNAAGVGSASDASPSIIPARIADAVSGLATTPGDEQLAVSWTALTTDQLGGGSFTRYDVYLRVNGGSWGSAVTPDGTNNLATRTTTSYTFTGLTNGTAYDVKIVAITSVNSTALSSNTSTALGVPATVPSAVSGLTATALSNTTAFASWSAPVDDGGSAVTAYSVNLSCTFVNATDTFCELSGLTAGSTVTVSVGATNLMGTGSTVSVSVTMPGGSSGGSGGGSSGSQAVAAATNAPVVAPRRVIVPVQPTPVPRLLAAPVRIIPERGFDPDAGAKARVGGQPATVTKKPLGEGGLSVEVGAFQLGIKLSAPGSSEPSAAGQRSDIDVPTGESTKVSGGGLLPGSSLQVWLPGVTGESPRELARIPVQSDGSFASELSFTSRQSETPIPIGPQVMQVTGYDEQGNQTIVDMVVNIGQGAPAPEFNRSVNELPDLSPGQSLATSAGTPETVRVEAAPQTGEVAVLSGEWAFTVAVAEDSGGVEQVASGATITMVQTKTATVSGEGFQPDTRVDIWLFSDPTLLGSVIVSADGSFTGEVYMDARYATPGGHTLQLQGVADDGFIKAANLGVVVQEPVEFTTENAGGLLWWVVGVFLLAVLVMVVLLTRRRRSA